MSSFDVKDFFNAAMNKSYGNNYSPDENTNFSKKSYSKSSKNNYYQKTNKKKRRSFGTMKVGSSASSEVPTDASGLYSWLIRYGQMSDHEKAINRDKNSAKVEAAYASQEGMKAMADAYEMAEWNKAEASVHRASIKAEAHKHNSDNVFKSKKEKYESKRKSSFMNAVNDC